MDHHNRPSDSMSNTTYSSYDVNKYINRVPQPQATYPSLITFYHPFAAGFQFPVRNQPTSQVQTTSPGDNEFHYPHNGGVPMFLFNIGAFTGLHGRYHPSPVAAFSDLPSPRPDSLSDFSRPSIGVPLINVVPPLDENTQTLQMPSRQLAVASGEHAVSPSSSGRRRDARTNGQSAPGRDFYSPDELKDSRRHVELLYVAIELSDERLFQSVAKSIQLHLETDGAGNFIHLSSGQKLLSAATDPNIARLTKPCLDNIMKYCNDAVDRILRAAASFFDRVNDPMQRRPCDDSHFIQGPNILVAGPSTRRSRNLCRSLTCGLLMHCLSLRGLWPIPEANDMHFTIDDLVALIREVLYQTTVDRGHSWIPVEHLFCHLSRFAIEFNDVVDTAVKVPNIREAVLWI